MHCTIEDITFVYQAHDAWCTLVGMQKEMDICLAWLKLIWLGNCLNGMFMLLLDDPPFPILKVWGMTFHKIQVEEDEWVNPLYAMGQNFFNF